MPDDLPQYMGLYFPLRMASSKDGEASSFWQEAVLVLKAQRVPSLLAQPTLLRGPHMKKGPLPC